MTAPEGVTGEVATAMQAKNALLMLRDVAWESVPERERLHWRDLAIAAMEALMEPSFDPETVSYHQGMTRLDWWRAMLSHALGKGE